jgi:hypothetical protein
MTLNVDLDVSVEGCKEMQEEAGKVKGTKAYIANDETSR